MSDQTRDPRDEALERRAREVFDASVEGIDARTAAQLARARAEALAEPGSRRRPAWQWAVPVAAAASAAVLAVLSTRVPDEPPSSMAARGDAAVVEPLELLAAGEDLELAADLEFYAWLEMAELDYVDGQG